MSSSLFQNYYLLINVHGYVSWQQLLDLDAACHSFSACSRAPWGLRRWTPQVQYNAGVDSILLCNVKHEHWSICSNAAQICQCYVQWNTSYKHVQPTLTSEHRSDPRERNWKKNTVWLTLKPRQDGWLRQVDMAADLAWPTFLERWRGVCTTEAHLFVLQIA